MFRAGLSELRRIHSHGRAAAAAEKLSVVEQFRDLSTGVITLAAAGLFRFFRGRHALSECRHPGASPLAHRAENAADARPSRGPRPGVGRHRRQPHPAGIQLHPALGRHFRANPLAVAPKPRRCCAPSTARQPVFIQAYFSPDVPRSYVEARSGLVAMLREFQAVSDGGVNAKIVETVKYSPQAREAQERFGIKPFRVPASEESARVMNEIFLGLAFTRGSEEFVIPFFDRGLPVEYELMRSIRVVSRAKRKKIGVLEYSCQAVRRPRFPEPPADPRNGPSLPNCASSTRSRRCRPMPITRTIWTHCWWLCLPPLTQPQADRLTAYVAAASRPCCWSIPCRLSTWNWRRRKPKANLRPLMDRLGVSWQTEPHRLG